MKNSINTVELLGTPVVKFVRDKRTNVKVGLVCATKGNDNRIYLGWSACNKKDDFNKEMAIKIAKGRMDKNHVCYVVNNPFDPFIYLRNPNTTKIPETYFSDLMEIGDRAVRYFKP